MKKTLLSSLAAVVVLLGSACGDANQTGSSSNEASPVTPATGPGDADSPIDSDPALVEAVDCKYPVSGDAAKRVDPPPTGDVQNAGDATAVVSLTAGDITITLDRATAPCTVNSFESLASQGYFDDTACHRLTDVGIFVLQCGDPSETGMGGPGYSYPDETDPSMAYPAGTVAMANAGPDTNGSQFFLVWADTDLPPDYTVFGTMDQAGLDVVAGIAAEGVSASDDTSPNAEAQISSVTLG